MKIYNIFIFTIFSIFFYSTLGYSSSFTKISSSLNLKIESSSNEELFPVWIYFIDKGNNLDKKLKITAENLLPQASKRRLLLHSYSNVVDFYDLPVLEEYVQEIRQFVRNIRHKSRWLNAVSANVTKEDLPNLINLSFVKKIDLVFRKTEPIPDVDRYMNNSMSFKKSVSVYDYGLSFDQNDQINIPALHDLGYMGEGILIAMLDAGFNNLEHEALTHLDIIATWDFVNKDSIVWDEPGQSGTGDHGTYTLSALAGFKEGQLIGPAFGASFLLAKTENTDSERHIEEDNWVAAAEWADSLGAYIISSSLGYRDEFTDEELDYSWADMDGNTTIVTIGADIAANRGILVVNSAGNEGPSSKENPNTIVAPSDGDSVLAVGAVGSDGIRTFFSSMGPTADFRIKPDVMAQGLFTRCASPYDSQSYAYVNGTSLSCPLVAGAAALVWQANPTLSNMDIMEAIKKTADNADNPNNEYGWGIINAYQAAMYLLSSMVTDKHEKDKIEHYELLANYPNPFNSFSTIHYEILKESDINISVYNSLGQRVKVLYSGHRNPGKYRLQWDASLNSSSIYYIMLKSQDVTRIRKALLIK